MKATRGFRPHPALITINEIECHALYSAFCEIQDDFIRMFLGSDDPSLAKRFGEGFKYAREESFVPTPVWKSLYMVLAKLGLDRLRLLDEDATLPCEHSVATHLKALENVIAKVCTSSN